MKLFKLKKLLLPLALIVCLCNQACKKKDTTTPTPAPTPNGTLMLHLHTNIDSNEVNEYNEVYVANNGRKVSLSIAQLFVSGIQLVKADGSTYDVPNVNILKTMEVEEYLVGSVPSGNYRSIRFQVGLSSATNSTTPASNDSTLNRPAMWFGSSAQPLGYVFVNFQGKIDTSNAANGTAAQMQTFSYKIGTNANLKQINMPDQNYSVLPNQTQFVHITVNYNKLFTGIQLNNANNLTMNTVSANSSTLAAQLAGNIASMFSYEE